MFCQASIARQDIADWRKWRQLAINFEQAKSPRLWNPKIFHLLGIREHRVTLNLVMISTGQRPMSEAHTKWRTKMLDKLIPWKRNGGAVKVHQDDNPLIRFRQEFDDLWDRFWSDTNWMNHGVNMDDNDKEYVVRAELPGFSAEEIEVKLSGNVLTLTAEHNEEKSGNNGSYQKYGSFHQSFTLPQGVLTDKIDADYQNGVLKLHLPKSEECKPKRIAVKAK